MREYHERSATVNLPSQLKEKKDNLDPARLDVVTAATTQDYTDHPIAMESCSGRGHRVERDTAPSEDGIMYSILNDVCNVEGNSLLQLYNMSLAQGVLPEGWIIQPTSSPYPSQTKTSLDP